MHCYSLYGATSFVVYSRAKICAYSLHCVYVHTEGECIMCGPHQAMTQLLESFVLSTQLNSYLYLAMAIYLKLQGLFSN